MANRMMFAGYRAVMVASATLLLAPALATAAPAEMALMRAPERVPDLQAQLPPQALANSAVVGQLTPGLMAASSIAITLEDGSKLVAKRVRDVSGPMGSKSWVGDFADAPGSQFVITEHRGTFSGFFIHGDAIYEIVASRGKAGSYVMYRVDEARLPPMSQPLAPPSEADTSATTASGSTYDVVGGSGTVVDLMILYTPAARANYGQAALEAQLLSAVAGANQAYLNSSVDMSLNVVYLGEVNYSETGNMGQALEALKGTNDGKMDEVHRLRDQYGADLVNLVSEDANWCGYAYLAVYGGAGHPTDAFSVIRPGCLSNLSLQHELGHSMGNMHDRDNSGGSTAGAFDYSFGYRRCVSDGYGFRTVMAYSCTGAPRVNYFSDPYINYNGYPTGIAQASNSSNSAENARSMRNSASTVAAFRSTDGGGGGTVPPAPSVPTAPSNTSAGAVSDQRIDVSWSDNSGDESGFRIERSPNGVNWSEIAQVGTDVRSYANTGLPSGTWYYYRVRAWNSVGTSGYSNVASARTQDPAPPAAPPPAPPASPASVAANASGSEVMVSWADQSSNESGFDVLREKYNSRKGTWGSAVTMNVAGANITSLVDSPGSGTFRYRVRSYNAGGTSGWAGPASATTSGSSTKGGGKGGSAKGRK